MEHAKVIEEKGVPHKVSFDANDVNTVLLLYKKEVTKFFYFNDLDFKIVKDYNSPYPLIARYADDNSLFELITHDIKEYVNEVKSIESIKSYFGEGF